MTVPPDALTLAACVDSSFRWSLHHRDRRVPGQPANLLTDPKAILAAAAASTSSATSVHVDLSADGASSSIRSGPAPEPPSTSRDHHGRRHRPRRQSNAFYVRQPNLMNIAGEIVAIDQYVYLMSSLTGAK